MKFLSLRTSAGLLALLVACLTPPARAADSCERSGAVQYVCGPSAAEDIVRVAGTRWLIASGLAEGKTPGRLHLIDSVNKQWEVAYPSASAAVRVDHRRFADCAIPPDASLFSAHGIAIHRTGHSQHSLLVVNHGREAIEYFTVESRGDKPQLTWVGCVPLPPDVYANSVARLPDGGFLATQFYTPSKGGMEAILTGALTGGVLEWHPGRKVVSVPGTNLSGANGLETSHNGRVVYVAAWGSHELVRFDRRGLALKKTVVPMDFAPDNLRWSEDGTKLIVAGQRFKAKGALDMEGWSVARASPETLAITPLFRADSTLPLQGVSVALEVDGQLWVGPFRGDRVGYLPLPN